jgi:hypothetical protein
MANEDDEVSVNKTDKYPRKRVLVQSKAESSHTTPSVGSSTKIPQLAAVKAHHSGDVDDPCEVSVDKTLKNSRKKELIPSKTESSRNTPSVENSSRILQLSAYKSHISCDGIISRACSGDTSLSRRASASSEPVVSAIVPPQAPVGLGIDRPSQQDTRRLAFYGREMKNIQVFNREVDKAEECRYHEVRQQLEPAVINFLLSKGFVIQNTAVRLMVLGANEDAAKPWIVVFCAYKARRKAKKFLRENLVTSMCQGQIKFDTAVCSSIEEAASENSDEVFIEQNTLKAPGAWTSQIKVMQSGTARYATMGGFVFVTMTDGSKSVYGLTAGHVLPLEELNNADAHMSSDEDSEDDESDEGSIVSNTDENYPGWPSPNAGNTSTLPDSSDSQDEVSADQEHPSWASLGRISKASYSNGAHNHDWALIELTTGTGPWNIPKATPGTPLEVVRPSGDRRAVIYNKSMMACTVSPLPARAILPSGHSFVDVDVLRPDTNEGSWLLYCYNK